MQRIEMRFGILLLLAFSFAGCRRDDTVQEAPPESTWAPVPAEGEVYLNQPLISHIHTADPSAHLFDGRIYIYPSHDVDTGVEPDDMGSHFDMMDYHVFSMDSVGAEVIDHGVALSVDQVPWAERQMWAPDAAERDGEYFLYFPAKDANGVFRIGAAVADNPAGPFLPDPEPIEGSYSIDPAVFRDVDGEHYMYFGGIWGGQLQRWESGSYREEDVYPGDAEAAIAPRVARLAPDMRSFAEAPREVLILDEGGTPITYGDNDRRFFEAAWVHMFQDRYYLSYSTGDTHYLVYAVGDSPYGPFTYHGRILEPVLGWTSHHSIVEANGRWHLFYHDSEISEGVTHLRNVKVVEPRHRPDGTIETMTPYRP